MQGAQAIVFCFLDGPCRWPSCGCLSVCLQHLYYCTASAQQDCLGLFVSPIFTSISIGHFTPE